MAVGCRYLCQTRHTYITPREYPIPWFSYSYSALSSSHIYRGRQHPLSIVVFVKAMLLLWRIRKILLTMPCVSVCASFLTSTGGERGPASRTPEAQVREATELTGNGTDQWANCDFLLSCLCRCYSPFLSILIFDRPCTSIFTFLPIIYLRSSTNQLSELVEGGLTTVVGLLGTDGVSRSMENLVTKARALEQEGLTAFIYTGNYHVPSPTVTSSISRDIMMV